MSEIIDSTNYLMSLSEDELAEKLLEDNYNKALLRELVRRSIKESKEYKDAFHDVKSELDKYLDRYNKVKFLCEELEVNW